MATLRQEEGSIMESHDLEYLAKRARIERSFAERAENPYVRACHQRLAASYEQAMADLLNRSSDRSGERVDRTS